MANYFRDGISPSVGVKINNQAQSWLHDTEAAKWCMKFYISLLNNLA